MLKKIDVRDLRLGMHLHAFEGAWIDHPFWRNRFVVEDAADLQKVLASGLRECWIDPALGLDVQPHEAPRPPPEAAEAAEAAAAGIEPPLPAVAARPAARAPAAAQTSSIDEELQHAAAICRRGRQTMTALFNDARLGKALDTEQCRPLVAEISVSVFRNASALTGLARLKTHDDYSYMHSLAVCALMVALGRQLGLDDEQCRAAGEAGLLHDVGKALIPTAILNKPGKLTDAEFAVVREHPAQGHALLQRGTGVGDVALEVCLHHHEKIDGSGYPDKLAGDAITLLSRMGAVCDVFDAVTSARPYKAAWDPAEAIAKMASWKGHFDPQVFATFVRSVGIYPVGALVRMESGRLGVVVDQNPDKPTAPVVRLFFSTKSNMPIPVLRLDLSLAQSNDRIVGRESAAAWGFRQIDDLWIAPEMRRNAR